MNDDDPIPYEWTGKQSFSIEEELNRLAGKLDWLVLGHLEMIATDYRRRWATPWRF